ncbi:MAG: tryptophan 2,3-dioxygenase [Microscillaceae bacterium]|nr:tryptophan 2,3-dioxygenase [Microscillaceae bacterium]
MENHDLDPRLLTQLRELEAKYQLTGQNLVDNLTGLQHANYLRYWDYIRLDTLLSLQNPRTDFPDEVVFIIYHQITELYFRLMLWEMQQISGQAQLSTRFFHERLQRLNRYVENLVRSFDIMVLGMEPEQFRQFRMALLPSSGFQSAQFREIEIGATDFFQLLEADYQNPLTEKAEIEEIFPYVYWKRGATDAQTGEETITLQHFEEKYRAHFIQLAKHFRSRNLWRCYLSLPPDGFTEKIRAEMRRFDQLMNIEWRLSHFRSAVRYLKKDQETLSATGGTNWQQYLPPRFQRTIFYPRLWSEEEKKELGGETG